LVFFCFFLTLRPPSVSPLFPYTTLFRSRQFIAAAGARAIERGDELEPAVPAGILDAIARLVGELAEVHLPGVRRQAQHEDVRARSEEHTSELQSRENLVCRLLLEKKK